MEDSEHKNLCNVCSGATSLRCKCQSVFYCSTKHQKKDWRKHKPACIQITSTPNISTETGKQNPSMDDHSNNVEKQKTDADIHAKAMEEKIKGNECFGKGNFDEALKHYNEAIKRSPQDHKLYSNRAACYTKMGNFVSALKDCEECVKLDPKFVKGYLRKGIIYTAKKEASKAMQAYEKAMEIDPDCVMSMMNGLGKHGQCMSFLFKTEAQEGYRSSLVSENNDLEEIRKRVLEKNPEIKEILSDTAMRSTLEKMQKDPNALRDNLKDPYISEKIKKLLQAGINIISANEG